MKIEPAVVLEDLQYLIATHEKEKKTKRLFLMAQFLINRRYEITTLE